MTKYPLTAIVSHFFLTHDTRNYPFRIGFEEVVKTIII
mgnify:CR=1 FL=1